MGSRDRYYSVLYRAAVRRSLSIRRIDYFYSGWHTYGIVFSQYVWLGPASRPFGIARGGSDSRAQRSGIAPVWHHAVRDQQLPLGCTVQARHGAVGATAGHTTTPKRGTSIFRADPESWNLDLRGKHRMKLFLTISQVILTSTIHPNMTTNAKKRDH